MCLSAFVECIATNKRFTARDNNWFNAAHLSNAFFSAYLIDSVKTTEVNALQLWKADSPTAITEPGITTKVSEVHESNAQISMNFIEFDN